MRMNGLTVINVEEFFTTSGKGLREVILTAKAQPPTPPPPPNLTTSDDSAPPDPYGFGFYVSFRVDQSLQQSAGPNSWGLYLSESAISDLARYLVSQGCPVNTAWEVAHEFVYRTVELEYLADCTLCKWDHLGWLHGHNPGVSIAVLPYLPELRRTGVRRARRMMSKVHGAKSLEAQSTRTLLDSRRAWETEYANFFVEYFGNHANGHVLWPDPFFPVKDLLKTVTDLLVTTAPKKSPIGTALPVHYIP
jgi:hypothetical protein